MPRPRRWVNRHGKRVKNVTGVSYNRARDRFYIIASDGKRQEFRTWDDAHAAYVSARADKNPKYLIPVPMPQKPTGSYPPRIRLPGLPPPEFLSSGPVHKKNVGTRTTRRYEFIDESVATEWLRTHLMADAKGLAKKVAVPALATIDTSVSLPKGGPRLRDVIDRWEQHKVEESGGRVTSYIRDVKRHWKQFVERVKNIHVAKLSPSHFRTFHSWLAREGAEYSSTQWQHDRASNIKSVVMFVRKKYPEWPWPAGVLEWADSYHIKAFKPKAANRRPMPVEVFAVLISQCRIWGCTDPKAIPATTQSGRGKREQARRKRRDGIQFEAILRLALNCGLDPIDIERISWDALKLNAHVPHMRFPRRKLEGMTGEAIERLAPLLPSTVESLRRWREHETPVGGPVFRTARKGRYGRNSVSATMKRLREEASVDESWSFKHMRNVGATLGKRGRRSRDERDAFLGHVVDGASKFYEGDVDETYLIPLVDLIGEQYFGGEKVGVS